MVIGIREGRNGVIDASLPCRRYINMNFIYSITIIKKLVTLSFFSPYVTYMF